MSAEIEEVNYTEKQQNRVSCFSLPDEPSLSGVAAVPLCETNKQTRVEKWPDSFCFKQFGAQRDKTVSVRNLPESFCTSGLNTGTVINKLL